MALVSSVDRTWVITRKSVSKPVIEGIQTDHQYTGTMITLPLLELGDGIVVSGTVSATAPGEYSATLTPDANHRWPDGTRTPVVIEWEITGSSLVALPTLVGSLVYTGSSQTPQWQGYDSSKLTLTVTPQTNAGNYTATFAPKTGYTWEDGSTASKTVEWSIAKAQGSLSVSPTSLSLDSGTPTKTITVTRSGDGAITATSSNTNVATVSVSGTSVKVTGKQAGSVTITISVAGGTNHLAPANKTVTATMTTYTTISNIPSQNGTLTYTGSAQSPSWSNYNSSQLTISGETAGTDAGSYTATFTPKSGYRWSNGSSSAMSVTWKIQVRTLTIPTQSGTLTYSGSSKTPSWSNYNSSYMTISGTTSGTNAGSYQAIFTLKSTKNCIWSDGRTTAKTVTWTIGRLSISVPSQSGTLAYTGSTLTPSWKNYNSSQLAIGGTTSGTNAGSYEATFTPLDNWCWSDKTFAAKSVTWTIGKKTPTFSISPTSLSFAGVGASLVQTINVTTDSNGEISASSKNTGVATTIVNGKTVKVTPVATGSTSIAVSVGVATNYLAAAVKSCDVNIISKNDMTASAFKTLLQNGSCSNLYKVGDSLAIKVSGLFGEGKDITGTYYPQILGFNHNKSIEGGSLTHYVDLLWATTQDDKPLVWYGRDYGGPSGWAGIAYRMNDSHTNVGGYNSSHMNTKTCPQFYSLINSDWKALIKNATKYTDNTGGGQDVASYVTSKQYAIWLLAEYEVFGQRYAANSAEQNYQKQYDLFKNGLGKPRYKYDSLTTAAYWWLRSPVSSISSAFVGVGTTGAKAQYPAQTSNGVAPAMRLAA